MLFAPGVVAVIEDSTCLLGLLTIVRHVSLRVNLSVNGDAILYAYSDNLNRICNVHCKEEG